MAVASDLGKGVFGRSGFRGRSEFRRCILVRHVGLFPPGVCGDMMFRTERDIHLDSPSQLKVLHSFTHSFILSFSYCGTEQEEREQGSGVMRDSAPRSSDGMAPPSDGGPSEAESQNRRIPPTPVCRDEVGLTSWLGKPLHLPARREQVWVLRLTLEFRMLPCIRGCRLTGLVTSRISRCVGG